MEREESEKDGWCGRGGTAGTERCGAKQTDTDGEEN